MRKAISRKGARRKHDDKSQPLSPTNSVGTEGTDVSKRKVSEGEAVLTAKNYRLAKELVSPNSVLLISICIFNSRIVPVPTVLPGLSSNLRITQFSCLQPVFH